MLSRLAKHTGVRPEDVSIHRTHEMGRTRGECVTQLTRATIQLTPDTRHQPAPNSATLAVNPWM